MYYIGQTWDDTPWGTVTIEWLQEDTPRTVKVFYSVEGGKRETPVVKHLDCERCMRFPIDVAHDNCKRPGEYGHSKAHCTAAGCF